MNKIEFHRLLNYLRCHPSEAKLLTDLLCEVVESTGKKDVKCDRWLSAREAGMQIGKSSTWIRRRFKDGLFRSARQDDKGKYMFLKSEVLGDYNSYVMAKTRNITIKN